MMKLFFLLILFLFSSCVAPQSSFRNYIISHSTIEEISVEEEDQVEE